MLALLVAFILARPFGMHSLFQRVMGAILGSYAKKCRKDVEVLHDIIVREGGEAGVDGQRMYDAVSDYVLLTSPEDRVAMGKAALESGKPLVNLIVASYTKAKSSEASSTADEVPTSLAPHLQKVVSLLSTARDYDGLMDFCNGPVFARIIKDTLTVVLYGPLTQWSKTCKLSDRVHDLQIFLTELVETVRSKEVDLAALLALCRKHQQRLYYLFSEAYTRGGTLTDPFKHWCAIGLTYMRKSTLDTPGLFASRSTSMPTLSTTAPNMSVSIPALFASLSPAERADVIRETDALVHWTKWMKIRWHVEMRRNILLQQGALGLAKKVDVDAAVRFVAGVLGEDTGVDSPVANGSASKGPVMATEKKRVKSAASTKLSLNDQFAWGWFADPAALAVLDADARSASYHRAGPRRPTMTATRKLLSPFLDQVGPLFTKADEVTLNRIRASPNGR
ncbi:hypothetical protein DL93DRAFT_2070883 [Clavulina sp. PMI_390]|nr:hypothetical protein DL93DRAFT_2070883 [Clavulina sp. PMI_390]